MALRRRGDHRLAGDESDSRPLRPRSGRRAGLAGRRRHGDGARLGRRASGGDRRDPARARPRRAGSWIVLARPRAPRCVANDRRTTVLASNARARYGEHARAWRPDLHLVLWNPFQALDVAAPTIVTWGYADSALDALQAWLEGRGAAPGRAPVPIAPA